LRQLKKLGIGFQILFMFMDWMQCLIYMKVLL
jgi:hypothetical protein